MIARVLKCRNFGPYTQLWLKAPAIARKAKPGQFIELKVPGAGATFWRRPFSLCNARAGVIELLIKSVGPGSRRVAQLQAGEELDVIGPLGRGFTLTGRAPFILVGGGFGVAPLRFLAERLKAQGRRVEVLIGGRCAEDLLLRRELRLARARVACTTEDGSFGTRGRVTRLLETRLAQRGPRPRIAAAGPKAMLAAVAKLAFEYGVTAEVSLEEVMACGLGVCNGCVVKVNGVYRRVCADGPVFDSQEVEW